MKQNVLSRTSLLSTLLSCLVLLGAAFAPLRATADEWWGEWWVEGETVYALVPAGWAADGSEFSGTIAMRMDRVIASGKLKIVTTILEVTPQPGFTYQIQKSGGVNGAVQIEFTRDTCQAKFEMLYKPGLTKIDYGVLRCR